MCGGGVAPLEGIGDIVDYLGFKLRRHASDMGTTIRFKDWQGKTRDMLVLDAAYRNVLRFGTYGTDVPGLANFTDINKNGTWYIDGGSAAIPDKGAMPASVTNAAIYGQWASSLAADKTARENCDIWMAYNSQTDTQNIAGVPAVAWCRQQIVDRRACDLPNEYETIVIWACGDRLDEMDRTASSYPSLKLGYTATGWDGYGRCQSRDGNKTDRLWSSTESSRNHVRQVNYFGYCNNPNKYVFGAVAPILEL